jgi:hypothetical protein
MKQRLSLAIAGAATAVVLASSALGQADVLYQAGFEQPPFYEGPLLGQNGWEVQPAQRGAAFVQTALAFRGVQAVEIIDRGECTYARMPLGQAIDKHFLIADFAMLIPDEWDALASGGERFEAQSRIELAFLDRLIPEPWVIEYGVIHTVERYGDLPAGASAIFLDIMRIDDDGLDDQVAFETEIIEINDMKGAWHEFQIRYDFELGVVCLLVDGTPRLDGELPLEINYIDGFKLCNERFGTDVVDHASLFFDNVKLRLLDELLGDVDDDNMVGVADLLILLGEWGNCAPDDPNDPREPGNDPGNRRPPDPPCSADLNGDGRVNADDLLILLANWG